VVPLPPETERSGPRQGRPDTNSDTAIVDPLMLYVGPVVSESAPAIVREGLVRRRLCFTNGGCPCGAQVARPNRAQRRAMKRDGGAAWAVAPVHAVNCPAVAPETIAWVRGWSA
jgi:hypothetical protein